MAWKGDLKNKILLSGMFADLKSNKYIKEQMCLISYWVNQVSCESLILRSNHNYVFNLMAHI
jgi:hypothetical protein